MWHCILSVHLKSYGHCPSDDIFLCIVDHHSNSPWSISALPETYLDLTTLLLRKSKPIPFYCSMYRVVYMHPDSRTVMHQCAANKSSDLSVWLRHVISCPVRKQSCPGQDPCEAAVPSDESHNSQHQMVSKFNWEWREEKKHIHAYRDWCVFINIFAVLHCLLLILHHYESQFKSTIHSVLLYQPALLVSRLLLWHWGCSVDIHR